MHAGDLEKCGVQQVLAPADTRRIGVRREPDAPRQVRECMSAVVKSESSKPKPVAPPRVLVVDDEPNLIELVGDVGADMGCKVVGACDVAEARRILETQ